MHRVADEMNYLLQIANSYYARYTKANVYV
jgi:hypothetical protein